MGVILHRRGAWYDEVTLGDVARRAEGLTRAETARHVRELVDALLRT